MAKKNVLPVSSPTVAYKPSKDDEARERRYRAEDALRTCKEYSKIQSDKQLMSDVAKLAKEEINSLKKVAK